MTHSTTEQRELTAGRELDVLVAEKVMGADPKTIHTYRSKASFWIDGAWVDVPPVPHYSTDIAAAWEVVEKMNERGYSVIIGTNQCDKGQNGVKFFDGWRGLGHSILDGEGHPNPYAVDATVPLTICLAALAALKAVEK